MRNLPKRLLCRCLVLVCAAMLVLAAACSGGGREPESPPDAASALRQSRSRWAARNVRDYRYTLLVFSAFGALHGEKSRPVIVEVRNGASVSITFADTGVPVGPDAFRQADTVDKLFDVIETAMPNTAGTVSAAYDPALGYPTEIVIDPRSDGYDDEYGYRVSDFQRVETPGR